MNRERMWGVLVANRPVAGERATLVADFHPEPAEYCRPVHLRCSDGRHWASAFGGGGEGLSSTAQGVSPLVGSEADRGASFVSDLAGLQPAVEGAAVSG